MIISPADLLVEINSTAKDLGVRAFYSQELNYFANISDSSRYKSFQIPKKKKDSNGNKQYRTIYAPQKRLSQFLMVTNQWLSSLVSLDEHAYGFVKGRSIVDNANQHIKKNFLFSVDLSNFFPSTSSYLVANSFGRNFPNLLSMPIMTLLINSSCVNVDGSVSLAQGSPLSPLLSNIACIDMDRQIAEMAKHFDVTYSRYADDMSFSAHENVFYDAFRTSLRNIVNGYGYKFNIQKTRLSRKGNRHLVTGVVVNEKVNVTRDYIKDLRNILYIWGKYGYAYACHRFQKAHRFKFKYAPRLELYVNGRIAFLNFVKGEESAVYQKFFSRYKALMDNLIEQSKDYKGNGVSYGSFRTPYKLSEFYKAFLGKSIKSNKDGKSYVMLGDYEKILVSPKIMKFWNSLPIEIANKAHYTFQHSRITMLPKGREFKWILSSSNHDMLLMRYDIERHYRREGMRYFNKEKYNKAADFLEIAVTLGNTRFYDFYLEACEKIGREVKY